MSVSQLIRETGLFEESYQPSAGTISFFYGRKGEGGSIYVQANDVVFHIYREEGLLSRFPNHERLRAYLESHAYRIGRPNSETASCYALHGEGRIREVLRIIRGRI